MQHSPVFFKTFLVLDAQYEEKPLSYEGGKKRNLWGGTLLVSGTKGILTLLIDPTQVESKKSS